MTRVVVSGIGVVVAVQPRRRITEPCGPLPVSSSRIGERGAARTETVFAWLAFDMHACRDQTWLPGTPGYASWSISNTVYVWLERRGL
jgi:hypothetical protein